MLKLYCDKNWVCFKTKNKSLSNLVAKCVKPSSYRRFEVTTNTWYVYYDKLPLLVGLARRFNMQVDWSDLPESWQVLIVQNRDRVIEVENEVSSAFKTLFLTEDAPIEVVKASYRALVSRYHPDHNDGQGDTEKLNELIKAYKVLVDPESS